MTYYSAVDPREFREITEMSIDSPAPEEKCDFLKCNDKSCIRCTTLCKSRSSELTIMRACKWKFLIECFEKRTLDGVCTLCQCPLTSKRDVSFRATWGEKGTKYVSCMSQGLIEYGI